MHTKSLMYTKYFIIMTIIVIIIQSKRFAHAWLCKQCDLDVKALFPLLLHPLFPFNLLVPTL